MAQVATPLAPAYGDPAPVTLGLLGWRYPASFSDAVEEHRAVRERAGLFDFSFMAHVAVRGPGAPGFLQRVLSNDVGGLAVGAALYSPITSERGTLVDDCTVIRRGADDFLVTAGLGATSEWLARWRAGHDCRLEDLSADLSVVSLQGPASLVVLAQTGCRGLAGLGYFRAAETRVGRVACLAARIGYSGELGYELFAPAAAAGDVWRAVHAAGREAGLALCGGVALQSLRIEAGYLMTQVDFDDTVTPLEAGLGRFVRLDKGDFVGRSALTGAAPSRRLRGLRMAGGEIPRRGAAVRDAAGRHVGRVTSASASPTLGGALAFAYLAGAHPGDVVSVEGVGGTAAVADLPFYDPQRRRVRGAPTVA